jgi:hypothetical protein
MNYFLYYKEDGEWEFAFSAETRRDLLLMAIDYGWWPEDAALKIAYNESDISGRPTKCLIAWEDTLNDFFEREFWESELAHTS